MKHSLIILLSTFALAGIANAGSALDICIKRHVGYVTNYNDNIEYTTVCMGAAGGNYAKAPDGKHCKPPKDK